MASRRPLTNERTIGGRGTVVTLQRFGHPRVLSVVSKTRRMSDDAVLDQQLIGAWRVAAEDLGIEVVAPFVLQVNGGELRCVALLKSFGHTNGMLVRRGGVAEWHEARELLDQAVDLGYAFTHLDWGPDYDRWSFIDALNDWGWHGDPDAVPDWYTGEPWTWTQDDDEVVQPAHRAGPLVRAWRWLLALIRVLWGDSGASQP